MQSLRTSWHDVMLMENHVGRLQRNRDRRRRHVDGVAKREDVLHACGHLMLLMSTVPVLVTSISTIRAECLE